MTKWISPIFSDARNALGKSVVFSNWKGRPYFRSYVIPANPRTNKQKAHRAVMKELVKRWQQIAVSESIKSAWDKEALSYQISGYNLFVKYGRLSKIEVPSTGTAGSPITITYTLGLPANKARIYVYDGSTWTDITPAEGLSSEPNSTLEWTPPSAGTYEFYIADGDVLVEGDSAPQPYQAITKWSPDETNGVAKEAKCVVS